MWDRQPGQRCGRFGSSATKASKSGKVLARHFCAASSKVLDRRGSTGPSRSWGLKAELHGGYASTASPHHSHHRFWS